MSILGMGEWTNSWRDTVKIFPASTSKQVVDILDNTTCSRSEILEWINQRWWKVIIQQVCEKHWPDKRKLLYGRAIEEFNKQSNNSYKLPSNPDDLYQIVMGKSPKYQDTLFHEIHNTLFPEEYIDFIMKRKEFTDWYYDSDATGKTGKQYIAFGMADNFWEQWRQIASEINRLQRIRGRWLLKIPIYNLNIQMPIPLKIESGMSLTKERWKTPNKWNPSWWEDDTKWAQDDWSNYWRDKWKILLQSHTVISNMDPTDTEKKELESLFINALSSLNKQSIPSRPIEAFFWWISEIEESDRKNIYTRRTSLLNSNIGLLKWTNSQKIHLYITFFIRAIARLGIPPGIFVSEYTKFEIKNNDILTISLHPIFFDTIGEEVLSDICTEVMLNINNYFNKMTNSNTRDCQLYTLQVVSL